MLKAITVLSVVATFWAAPAQTPDPSVRPFRLSVTAELVALDVGVEDALGRPVLNLSKDSFRVYEDGKPQSITQFSSEDSPVTVGLVIDTSSSMRGKYSDAVAAALAFIRASNPKDEVFVVNFGDRVSSGLPPGVPFSSDLRQLGAALSTGKPAGRTALYDAVLYSLRRLEQGTCEKRALMLISDGGDNSSVHGQAEAMLKVRESRATIYTIGLMHDASWESNSALLRRMADVSGGEAFFPQETTEAAGICALIAGGIRKRYTLSYAPNRTNEKGAVRRLKVVAFAPDGRKLVVHTRTSYVLPPECSPVDPKEIR